MQTLEDLLKFFSFMSREGAKGDEIIEALIANSKTFDKKFQLSQVCIYIVNLSASTLKVWETYN